MVAMFKMAKTIFKNLFSIPKTRKYPHIIREPFKRARGHLDINIDDCILCGICSKQCPVGAIKVDKDTKTWEVDPFKCILCEYCTAKCPKKCLMMKEEYTKVGDKKVYKVVKEPSEDGS